MFLEDNYRQLNVNCFSDCETCVFSTFLRQPISEIDALFPELVEGRIEKFICKNLLNL